MRLIAAVIVVIVIALIAMGGLYAKRQATTAFAHAVAVHRIAEG